MKKYRYRISLPRQRAEALIQNKGKAFGLYVRNVGGQLIIRKPKLAFGCIPVNFQVSFVANLYEDGDETTILGKFDAPKLFYLIWFSCVFVFQLAFLLPTLISRNFDAGTLIVLFIQGVFGVLFIAAYVGISRLLFARRNKAVLEFIQSLASTYPSEKQKK